MKNILGEWLLDIFIFFSATLLIYSVQVLLIFCKKSVITLKELGERFLAMFGGEQASLLVISYNIMTVKRVMDWNYIEFFREIEIVMLVLGIIYNLILYVLVKELGQVQNQKLVTKISVGFLLFSVVGSLVYAILQ